MVKREKGFTLIELLVVMAIVAILAGFVVSATQVARKRAAITKAKSSIAALETALSMYEVDMGDYPQGGNKEMVQALTVDPGGADWFGPYMKFREEDLTEEGEYMDPWGNPYKYISPGVHNSSSYDIYSFGPNGEDQEGTGDDIKNW
jgi:general secretion pathway protein G